MKKIHIKLATVLFTVFSIFSNAHAGFDITRMTTVVDDFQGSYTVTNSGRRDDGEFAGTELAEFTNFHPLPDNADVSMVGTLSKVMERGDGNIETTADAEMIFSGPEETVNISFESLEISGNRETGISLDGIITVNGEDFAAGDLPAFVRNLLKTLFKLTH